MNSPHNQRARKGNNPRYPQAGDSQHRRHAQANSADYDSARQHQNAASQQYFTAHPDSADIRHTQHLNLRGHELRVQISNGVFSSTGLDKGTAVLLKLAPPAPPTGTFLDLGSGWGPITLSLALESPRARVIAVDVNERAVELTATNAAALHLSNVTAVIPSDLEPSQRFDLIWSNPPIRVGKKALHELLLSYLPRLSDTGRAYLVVQKHLGADSLIPWLATALGKDFAVTRFDSSKGFRIIEVMRLPKNTAITPSETSDHTQD